MKLTLQKRLAAIVMKCSAKRVIFDPARLEDIKEAITKTDIRLLVGEGAIKERQKKGVSRVRANKRKIQRAKGLRKGGGHRKGKATARESKKEVWMRTVRAQRTFLKKLRFYLEPTVFRQLYAKSKGGFFRSINHIKIYVRENNMIDPTKVKEKVKVSKPAKTKPKPTVKKSK